jgi:hypothetical protein
LAGAVLPGVASEQDLEEQGLEDFSKKWSKLISLTQQGDEIF